MSPTGEEGTQPLESSLARFALAGIWGQQLHWGTEFRFPDREVNVLTGVLTTSLNGLLTYFSLFLFIKSQVTVQGLISKREQAHFLSSGMSTVMENKEH